MKKFFMFGSLAIMIGLSACSTDGYSEMTQVLGGGAITIISSENSDEVITSEGIYKYDLKITDKDATGSVTSPDLVAENNVLNFTTDVQAYKNSGFEIYFGNAQGKAGNFQLNNANFAILVPCVYNEEYNQGNNKQYGYFVNESNVGKYTYKVNISTPDLITVATYNIGNSLKVNTFQKNTFFVGETQTSYTMAGETHTYSTKNITYRFMLNKEEKDTEYTADLLIYNAKFSDNEREPVKEAILAQGLNVEFGANGITISGENIIPQMLEAGEYVPVPSFMFNSIKFKTVNSNYTKGQIEYLVAGMYQGTFTGEYASTLYLK